MPVNVKLCDERAAAETHYLLSGVIHLDVFQGKVFLGDAIIHALANGGADR